MFARNKDGRWLTARSMALGYDPLDDQSMTGFRRPPRDAACVVDYVLAIRKSDASFLRERISSQTSCGDPLGTSALLCTI